MGIGATELVIVLVIVLVLFGGKKLPGLAKSMGDSIKEFRKATEEMDKDESGDATDANADDTKG
jgi:sec-independent protein translocase protein TatA